MVPTNKQIHNAFKKKPVKSAMQFGDIRNNESNMYVRIVYTDIDYFREYSYEETDEPLPLNEFKQVCADFAETTNGNFTVSHENGYQPAEYIVSFATWDQFVDESNPDYNPYDEESLGSDKDRIGEMIGEFDNALNNSTRLEVELTRKKLEDLLDEIENKGFTGLIS